ncbi:MAG: pantetheine-phosphate adenylyltransferase [Bdellovibrionota bacterium]
MERRAIYAGSFDPPTFGHFDVIRKMSALFDVIHVVVADNTRKKTLFTVEERVKLFQDALAKTSLPSRVEVQSHDGLIIDFARAHKAGFLIRGIRAVSDYENELHLAMMNRKIAPEIETVLVMADEKHFFVSSSLVKEVAFHGGPLGDFVPPNVETTLKKKFAQEGGSKNGP